MKNISKNKIFVKVAFIPHLKKWVFPQPNHKIGLTFKIDGGDFDNPEVKAWLKRQRKREVK